MDGWGALFTHDDGLVVMVKRKARLAPGFSVGGVEIAGKQVPPLRAPLQERFGRDDKSYSLAAISSASPSWRIISSSRSASSQAVWTSCWIFAAASSSSGESWTLR